MNHAYIFDIDGTLTPSRRPIVSEFQDIFTQFCYNHDVFLVTGSDYPKAVEQLGQDIVDEHVKLVYCCSGNSVWEHGREIRSLDWTLDKEAVAWLLAQLGRTEWTEMAGNHIEVRTGAVNFSIPGRQADFDLRKRFTEWDQEHKERKRIASAFNRKFSRDLEVRAFPGGETSIDIIPKGHDKGQIIADFHDRPVKFFGDRCQNGGNDYPLARAIKDRNFTGDQVIKVQSWQDTMREINY